MDRKTQAVEKFNQGYNCSQAVLSVFSEALGLDEQTALKIASGFGAGMRQGEVCGAVTGAIMAIGLKYGHSDSKDIEAKLKAYRLTEEFEEAFIAKEGSLICKDLLKYDVSDEDDLMIIQDKKLFTTICPKMVERAVEIAEALIITS